MSRRTPQATPRVQVRPGRYRQDPAGHDYTVYELHCSGCQPLLVERYWHREHADAAATAHLAWHRQCHQPNGGQR